MNDLMKVLFGPMVTIGMATVWVLLYFGTLKADVVDLQEAATQSKADHDNVVAMGKDIEYIKEAITRIEYAVLSHRKPLRNAN